MPSNAPQQNQDAMVTDDAHALPEPTQQTQEASQYQQPVDDNLWGALVPCNPNLRRIDLLKVRPTYRIGRNSDNKNGRDGNDLIFPGMKISNFHCVLQWDGVEGPNSAVRVTDMSSNGTFINGEKIGKGHHSILREGSEIAFGQLKAASENGGTHDYRFIYRHLAAGPPQEGLYKYYEILHELGKGSFATVMKALNKVEGRWYAVKMIQSSKLRKGLSVISMNGVKTETNPSDAFIREISILQALNHPNICQLKEVFFDSYNINLVLEWITGGDLLEYILKNDGLNEAQTQHITYQLCDALAYIHRMGIAHRDLKPENVLLTSDDPPIVKVADFGLAKVVDSATRLRTMCGTPDYLAPEVVTQSPDGGYGQVVDSWSVGVIVFSMLTVSMPFPKATGEAVMVNVANRVVEWSTLDPIGVSAECRDFIARLLEIDPRDRMTAADARFHPWLAPYAAIVAAAAAVAPPAAAPAAPPPAPAPIPASQETEDPEEEEMEMDADGDAAMNAEPNPPTPPSSALRREPSRLQRRGHVIEDHAERGEMLPMPSQQMMENVEERSAAVDAFGEDDGELTPMEEDDEEEEEEVPAPKTPARRRKAAPPPAKSRAKAKVLAVAEEGGHQVGGGPRRSGRTAASPAKTRGSRRA